MYEQNRNINKEIKTFKKNPKEIFRAEKYNTWNEKFTRSFQKPIWADRKISELEDKTIEMIDSEGQGEND